MAYQSTTDSSRKFGSAFRGKRFDAYHNGEQPEVSAEPKEEGSSAADVTKAHGPAHTIHIAHDHEGKKHVVSSEHEDGHTHETEHGSAKEAHDSAEQLSLEAGGEEQASNVKKRTHPDQQGAESEERGYEMPDLA
jgi:hypothetical protein